MSWLTGYDSEAKQESHIIWVGLPPECYDYLREGVMSCTQRVRFPLKKHDPAKCTDGGARAHIVAYACLRNDAIGVAPWLFNRRYWWVKEYDRFKGHSQHRSGWYHAGAPCEATLVESIIPGTVSVGWDNSKPPTPWPVDPTDTFLRTHKVHRIIPFGCAPIFQSTAEVGPDAGRLPAKPSPAAQ